MDDDPNDKRAKDVLASELDAQTQADLQRWFGLPSFDKVAEQGGTTEEQDIELMLRQERQQKAIDAVDPALLEAHRRRTEPADNLLTFKATIELVIDPSIAKLDTTRIAAASAPAIRFCVSEPFEGPRWPPRAHPKPLPGSARLGVPARASQISIQAASAERPRRAKGSAVQRSA